MNKTGERGLVGEDFTVSRLKARGYQILARNYHTCYGEIDIIAATARYIVFVEVKTRMASSGVAPEEAVTLTKQKRLLKTALLYLQKYPSPLQPRFDVAGVLLGEGNQVVGFRYTANAFEGEGFL